MRKTLTALSIAAVATALVGCGAHRTDAHHTPTRSTVVAAASPAPASAAPTTTPPPRSTPARVTQAGPLLLWPFTTRGQAAEWERSFREGGHQPWHTSPCDTGQSFVQFVLGFSEVTEVARCEVSGDDAWVTVGYPGEGRVDPTGGTIHLVRLGQHPGGWTIVGSRDRPTMTLVSPGYGETVGTHVRLAGEVGGLGEDVLTVKIMDRFGNVLGQAPQRLIGLGGPWQADVNLARSTDRVLIAVAWTDSGRGALGDLAITALRANG